MDNFILIRYGRNRCVVSCVYAKAAMAADMFKVILC